VQPHAHADTLTPNQTLLANGQLVFVMGETGAVYRVGL
jgi:hypothetical protein